ncbi:hypothetical protein [Salinicola peritrichatus]|uniref:hypothetical protein n=1 Tax=Salinicola peritrichatus TaxID=1267424 RepID=UPI000DA234DC|nr:hypothetical protein [Salinicola peritrichatus]
MRFSQFASLIAIALLSTGAMAQSDSDTSQSAKGHDPDMQADTIEGEGEGASAQYEMSNEDGQTSDDVDDGDPSSISAEDRQDKEETIRHENADEEH